MIQSGLVSLNGGGNQAKKVMPGMRSLLKAMVQLKWQLKLKHVDQTPTAQSLRNYATAEIDLHPVLNIFVGDNAQGKTNLLEAMYILAVSKSYRALGRELDSSFPASTKVYGRTSGTQMLT